MPKGYTDADFQPLQNVEALANFDGKSILSRYHYADVIAREHALAFSVAKMLDEDMLSEVQSAITDALTNGTDFRDFEKRLKPYLMSRGWWGEQVMSDPKDGSTQKVQLGSTRRLRTIYHTNLHSSYAAGQWQRIQETKRALPYLQYMPSVAGKKRDEHKPYYNLVRPVDDIIWQRIMPPNGYGCLCWVKQLTRSQARREGISDEMELETVETVNPRTGETSQTPLGIEPSFDHNHDRNTAMQTLYAEKLQTWTHIPDTQKDNHLQRYEQSLDEYMLALVRQPNFADVVPTVNSTAFSKRMTAIKGGADIADERWAVSTLSPSVQSQLGVTKSVIWLPDNVLSTLVVADADSLPSLLYAAQNMIENIIKVDIKDGKYLVKFAKDGTQYEAVLSIDAVTQTLNIADISQV